MIDPRDVATGLGAGILLLVLALVPGMFQQLVDGVRNAAEMLGSPLEPRSDHESVETPTTWLLAGGVALILLTLLAYTVE